MQPHKLKSETGIIRINPQDKNERNKEKKTSSILSTKGINLLKPTNDIYFNNKIVSNTGMSKYLCHKKAETEANEIVEEKLTLDILNKEYTNYTNGSSSDKSFGIIKSYAMNTYIGLKKQTNEDKIVVVNHVKKPANSAIRNWPKISYYGVFDGHGGENCAEFLKNNLLNYIIEAKDFPMDVKASLIKGFEKAEEEFSKNNVGEAENADNSGSCALVILIVENKIYIANIGDSRAVLSLEGGEKIKPLTIDHKPNNPKEFERITKAGGKVFLDEEKDKMKFISNVKEFDNYCGDINAIFREHSSNMAVSRSIGDSLYKGKNSSCPGSIISTPEIFILDYYNYYDFIVMGCDGIYDFLSNNQIIDAVWFTLKKISKEKNYDINKITQDACNMVIKYSLSKQTEDNVSCILIGLEGLEKYIKNKMAQEKISHMSNDKKKNK